VKIAPSILSSDFLELGRNIEILNNAGIEILHLDVMDGHFVPNLTFGPPLIKTMTCHFKGLSEAHLMIEKPEQSFESYIKAGCGRIFVHVEGNPHFHRLCQNIRSCGAEVAAVLNPSTPLESLEYVWDELDMVLLMTVNPGFGGQSYIKAVEEKIKRAVQWKKVRKPVLIEIDGGVNKENIAHVQALGVDVAVVGSAIFTPGIDALQSISDLRARLS
jgi:ribulose-phosphate 3-epimerase